MKTWLVCALVTAACSSAPVAVTIEPSAWHPFHCMSWTEGHETRNECFHTIGACASKQGEQRHHHASSCVMQDEAACTREELNDGTHELCFSNATQCERFRQELGAVNGNSTPCESRRF